MGRKGMISASLELRLIDYLNYLISQGKSPAEARRHASLRYGVLEQDIARLVKVGDTEFNEPYTQETSTETFV